MRPCVALHEPFGSPSQGLGSFSGVVREPREEYSGHYSPRLTTPRPAGAWHVHTKSSVCCLMIYVATRAPLNVVAGRVSEVSDCWSHSGLLGCCCAWQPGGLQTVRGGLGADRLPAFMNELLAGAGLGWCWLHSRSAAARHRVCRRF